MGKERGGSHKMEKGEGKKGSSRPDVQTLGGQKEDHLQFETMAREFFSHKKYCNSQVHYHLNHPFGYFGSVWKLYFYI